MKYWLFGFFNIDLNLIVSVSVANHKCTYSILYIYVFMLDLVGINYESCDLLCIRIETILLARDLYLLLLLNWSSTFRSRYIEKEFYMKSVLMLIWMVFFYVLRCKGFCMMRFYTNWDNLRWFLEWYSGCTKSNLVWVRNRWTPDLV